MIFHLGLELYLNYNQLIYLFKNPTKNWRCQVMFLNNFYAKISSVHWRFWALHQVSKSGPVGNFALQPILIFLSILHQNFGMFIGVYYSTLCKNPLMFLVKFEWINLFFILVQLGDLYCIPIKFCSSGHELSPACSTPYQTLKSRRVDPLEDFWLLKQYLFPSA